MEEMVKLLMNLWDMPPKEAKEVTLILKEQLPQQTDFLTLLVETLEALTEYIAKEKGKTVSFQNYQVPKLSLTLMKMGWEDKVDFIESYLIKYLSLIYKSRFYTVAFLLYKLSKDCCIYVIISYMRD